MCKDRLDLERTRKQLDYLTFSHNLTYFRDLVQLSQYALEPVAQPLVLTEAQPPVLGRVQQ